MWSLDCASDGVVGLRVEDVVPGVVARMDLEGIRGAGPDSYPLLPALPHVQRLVEYVASTLVASAKLGTDQHSVFEPQAIQVRVNGGEIVPIEICFQHCEEGPEPL